MLDVIFDGQQEDEKILYVIKSPKIVYILSIINLIIISGVLFFIVLIIGAIINSGFLWLFGLIISLTILVISIYWNNIVHKESKTYITDRRIIRFIVVSPFFKTKRALFWNEALKAKAFSRHILFRLFNIGTVQIEPHLTDHENVIIDHVYMYDDVANYIDKILFIFKNKPEDILTIKPFVPKPKGQRE